MKSTFFSILLFMLFAVNTHAQTLVKDINPGSTGSGNPNSFIAFGDKTYFIADDGTHGYELWKTDGTTQGTAMVIDINPGIGDGVGYKTKGYSFTDLVIFKNLLYFFANDGVNGFSLWKSDGTEAGTLVVKSSTVLGGLAGSGFLELYNDNGNTLYFGGNDGTSGTELWKSDGTEGGTILVKDINTGSGNALPKNFIKMGNAIYFNAFQTSTGYELWKTDGTTVGTTMVKDIDPLNDNSGNPKSFVVVNNQLLFAATTAATGIELWKSDGTDAGTIMIKDIEPGKQGYLDKIINFSNTKAIFQGDDGINGEELWITDGTTDGTMLLKNIKPGSESSAPYAFALFNGKAYFVADDGTHGQELWQTDGTTLGTTMVIDINNVSNGDSYPYYFYVANGSMYFQADDGTNGSELWKTDGTAAGTVPLNQICAGTCESFPADFYKSGNTLYFSASETSTREELYKLDLPANGIFTPGSSNNAFTLYPNPATEQLTISSKQPAAGSIATLNNLLGQTITTQKVNKGDNSITLNISHLTAGIYIITLTANDGSSASKRFVKE